MNREETRKGGDCTTYCAFIGSNCSLAWSARTVDGRMELIGSAMVRLVMGFSGWFISGVYRCYDTIATKTCRGLNRGIVALSLIFNSHVGGSITLLAWCRRRRLSCHLRPSAPLLRLPCCGLPEALFSLRGRCLCGRAPAAGLEAPLAGPR